MCCGENLGSAGCQPAGVGVPRRRELLNVTTNSISIRCDRARSLKQRKVLFVRLSNVKLASEGPSQFRSPNEYSQLHRREEHGSPIDNCPLPCRRNAIARLLRCFCYTANFCRSAGHEQAWTF